MEMKSFTILVIDGNRVSRRVYSKLLHKHFRDRCRILEVERGEDGFYFCETQDIDCVLIDYHLPDMHGLEFLNSLNSRIKNHYIPVVILTGQGDETTAVQAMKSGAQDYLVKGTFSQELLAQAVTNAMEKVALLEELDKKRLDLEYTNTVLKKEIQVRHEVEESLRLFRNLINQTDDSLFILDPDSGMLLDFNDTTATNLGYPREELVRMDLAKIDVRIGTEKSWQNLINIIRIKSNKIIEGIHRCKDGSEYPVEVNFKHITQGEKRFLVAVARNITERKKVEQQLRDLSNRDGLTGVYNRRYLDHALNQEWLRLRRTRTPLSLIMIDVDFFKSYNDTYGHQAGDLCLKNIARFLESNTHRPADVVARYGGEEFLAVLPETNALGALHLANDFRDGVNSLELVHASSQVSRFVTISLGVATMVPDEQGVQSLVEKADQALYQAKKDGRNRVVAAE